MNTKKNESLKVSDDPIDPLLITCNVDFGDALYCGYSDGIIRKSPTHTPISLLGTECFSKISNPLGSYISKIVVDADFIFATTADNKLHLLGATELEHCGTYSPEGKIESFEIHINETPDYPGKDPHRDKKTLIVYVEGEDPHIVHMPSMEKVGYIDKVGRIISMEGKVYNEPSDEKERSIMNSYLSESVLDPNKPYKGTTNDEENELKEIRQVHSHGGYTYTTYSNGSIESTTEDEELISRINISDLGTPILPADMCIHDGHLFIVNTTDRLYKLEIPSLELVDRITIPGHHLYRLMLHEGQLAAYSTTRDGAKNLIGLCPFEGEGQMTNTEQNSDKSKDALISVFKYHRELLKELMCALEDTQEYNEATIVRLDLLTEVLKGDNLYYDAELVSDICDLTIKHINESDDNDNDDVTFTTVRAIIENLIVYIEILTED